MPRQPAQPHGGDRRPRSVAPPEHGRARRLECLRRFLREDGRRLDRIVPHRRRQRGLHRTGQWPTDRGGAVGSTSLSLPPDGNGAARTERELAVDTRTYASIYPELRTSLPTATPRRGLLFVALGLEYSFIEVPVQPHLNLGFDASGSGLLSDF